MNDEKLREEALIAFGKAYMDVKAGRVSALLVVLDDDAIEIQTANMNSIDGLRAAIHAVRILGSQMCDFVEAMTDGH